MIIVDEGSDNHQRGKIRHRQCGKRRMGLPNPKEHTSGEHFHKRVTKTERLTRHAILPSQIEPGQNRNILPPCQWSAIGTVRGRICHRLPFRYAVNTDIEETANTRPHNYSHARGDPRERRKSLLPDLNHDLSSFLSTACITACFILSTGTCIPVQSSKAFAP
ncbi:MAG: hypothetical protein BWY82_00950 [Verrucomicrobia bacterium ADurb.Bin474]|nr:MAG: hypothetical protein BWY82_00950 [Verrucomicrobia bacterium ADurb.Bin474]